MKLLVVHPGASWSTHDVHVGLVEGLRANGVPLAEFRLDTRIARAHDFLHFLWRRQKKAAPGQSWPKPSSGDVLYQASQGIIERALERGCTDIVVVSAMFLLPDRIELARRAGLRVWLLCTETPYDLEDELRIAGLVDGVWTHERAAIEAFRGVNAQAAYLPHAWRRGVHDKPASTEAPLADVLFCGSFFDERIKFFEAIDWTGIDLAIYGGSEMLPTKSPLKRFVRGNIVPNDQVVDLARRSRIVMNLFRSAPQGVAAESLNPRCYEMAAARVCMVSDARAEVSEFFGASVPTFSTPEEAGALIRALLADSARREALAAQAAEAVAASSWTERTRQVLADLDKWRNDAPQLMRSA
jgi:hypothetical protein